MINSLVFEIKNGKSFIYLAKELGISEYTLRYDWLIKGNTIPLSVFRKLIRLNPKLSFEDFKSKIEILEPYWGQKSGNKYFKPYLLPSKNTKEFAEFYGIMLGDGCLYSDLKGICISGDKILEREYFENYLKKLLKNLFNMTPRINLSNANRSLRLIMYSKPISEYLLKIGFPKGKKLNHKIKIPKYILKNNELTSYCIRGLFDTDGSLSAHPHSKAMIHLSVTSESLRDSICLGFNHLGIKVGKYNKGILIYGENKINQFYKIIGSSNPKNLFKFKQFIKIGKIPTSKETESFLMSKSS
ncbi:MAG: LAGLIDADG family homing endonuclease [archaeon]